MHGQIVHFAELPAVHMYMYLGTVNVNLNSGSLRLEYRNCRLKYTGEYATAQISRADLRPTAQTQQPTVCHTGTGTAVLYVIFYMQILRLRIDFANGYSKIRRSLENGNNYIMHMRGFSICKSLGLEWRACIQPAARAHA